MKCESIGIWGFWPHQRKLRCSRWILFPFCTPAIEIDTNRRNPTSVYCTKKGLWHKICQDLPANSSSPGKGFGFILFPALPDCWVTKGSLYGKEEWSDAHPNMQLQRFVKCSYLVGPISLPYGLSWASLFLANREFESSLSSTPASVKTCQGALGDDVEPLFLSSLPHAAEWNEILPYISILSKLSWDRLKRSAHTSWILLYILPRRTSFLQFMNPMAIYTIPHASSPSSRWEWTDLRPQVLSIWHADPSKTRCCEWGDRHNLAVEAAG